MTRLLSAALCALAFTSCVTEPVEGERPGQQWSFADQDETLFGVFPPPPGVDPPSVDEPSDGGGVPLSVFALDGDDVEADDDVAAVGGEDLTALLGTATPADLDDDLDYLDEDAPSPYRRLGRNVIRGLDGTWSKHYTLRGGTGPQVTQLLASSVPNFAPTAGVALPEGAPPEQVTRWMLHPNFYSEVKETVGIRKPVATANVSDLLIVTAPPETLLFIDEFLYRVLGDRPQIELEVRVVEVNLDDLIDYDAQVQLSRLENPDLPFNAIDNPTAGNFGAGLPIELDGAGDQGLGAAFGSFAATPDLPGFLLSLQGVHGRLTVDTLISILQTVTSSELISSPTITVLNGTRAILNTGDRIPTFEAKGVGLNPSIVTVYQNTGVNIELLPYILSQDEGLIRIDLSVDVSTVTAEVPFNLAGTEVLNPVISQRQAGTTVHVHDGQTFAIGGLRSTQNIEVLTKVPLLGDIPLLGWLFKSRSSTRVTTEIVFFITPRVRIPSENLVNPLG